MNHHHTNIVRIRAVYRALAALQDKVVFVGGATVSLYADKVGFEARPTDDVDVIVEIVNYYQRTELEEQLRRYGFSDDIESNIVCRFRIKGIIVDVMPTAEPSIGFSNKWYPEGFKQAVSYAIDGENTIKILSAPFFISTKLEAFKGRGGHDGRTSQDLEDIVYVLENRKAIWRELNEAGKEVKDYLRSEFTLLLKNPNITEWIDCHVVRGSPPATYFILNELKKFIS